MLLKNKYTEIPILGSVIHNKTFSHYDGPTIFSAQDSYGQNYFAMLFGRNIASDEDPFDVSWSDYILVKLSEKEAALLDNNYVQFLGHLSEIRASEYWLVRETYKVENIFTTKLADKNEIEEFSKLLRVRSDHEKEKLLRVPKI